MMNILNNVQLKPHNTFGIDVKSKYFTEVNSIEGFLQLIDSDIYQNNEKLILGGGSNLLFTKDFEGVVIKNNIKGIEVVEENEDYVHVKSGGGEVWHEFVLKCIDQNWAGIENLSLIPGCVGASPIQNIGAYGVEIKDVFVRLTALDLVTGEKKIFEHAECEFGYRDSVFKRHEKGKYFIVDVTFQLNKTPTFRTDYGNIKDELERMQVTDLSIQKISQAVVNIRSSKLPNPAEIGNAGSFFKNPVIPNAQFEAVKEKFPSIVGYPAGEGFTKVAAGWLIDQAGWKGKTLGNHGVHKNQALVLVNYDDATGKQVYDLSESILQSIKEKFGIELEREVNIL